MPVGNLPPRSGAVRLEVRLAPEQYDWFTAYARRKNRSMNALVRDMVERLRFEERQAVSGAGFAHGGARVIGRT